MVAVANKTGESRPSRARHSPAFVATSIPGPTIFSVSFGFDSRSQFVRGVVAAYSEFRRARTGGNVRVRHWYV